ncbi:MAG: redox-sensing transcriptional repressor Rex [Lentimicrobium sp.]|nr:redox-sensing transcriptional repressor Rex [Lentimicrobium sp.]
MKNHPLNPELRTATSKNHAFSAQVISIGQAIGSSYPGADSTGPVVKMPVSVDQLKRLGLYLSFLRLMRFRGRTDVSLHSIAEEFGLSENTVEEDVTDTGLGLARQFAFNIEKLTVEIEKILGYRNDTEAFLVGAGKLGTSLLLKENLGQTDLKIVAAFDTDYRKIGNRIGSITVMSIDKLLPLASRMHVCLGLIATPSGEAQNIADMLTGAGIRALWNFTSDEIETDRDIIIENTRIGQDLNAGYLHLIQQLRS